MRIKIRNDRGYPLENSNIKILRNGRILEKNIKLSYFDFILPPGFYNLEIYNENGELVPSRKTIPLTASSGKTRIEGVLPRLINIEAGLFFDTEHRNLPMVYQLSVGDSSRLVFRYEADKGNIVEASSFWRIYQCFLSTGRLAFIEPNTGDILFSCVREVDERGNREHSRRVSR